MTRKDDPEFATDGVKKTAPGNSPAAAHCVRDDTEPMHPLGAVPSQEMIESLNPAYLARAIAPEQWERTAASLGHPDLDPMHAPEIVEIFIRYVPIEERARLVRDYVAELFTLLSMAREVEPRTSLDVVQEFPGLEETFYAATEKYGASEVLRAIGLPIH
ncbi:MAG: hypothetical protein RH946_18170 [Rhodospirillales bacterium]